MIICQVVNGTPWEQITNIAVTTVTDGVFSICVRGTNFVDGHIVCLHYMIL